MPSFLANDSVWTDKWKYTDAEKRFYEKKAFDSLTPLAREVARARQRLLEIKITGSEGGATSGGSAYKYAVEELDEMRAKISDLQAYTERLASRIDVLEKKVNQPKAQPVKPVEMPKKPTKQPQQQQQQASKKKEEKKKADEDVDLFGSDDDEEEDETAAKIREERLAAYNAKKSKKPALIAKSNIIFDVKPWDDETDMKKMEKLVRDIQMDGLIWGAAKLVPLAYGINKLQISCVVEDEKVSVDLLQETIGENEDYVQSVDIAAFNKV